MVATQARPPRFHSWVLAPASSVAPGSHLSVHKIKVCQTPSAPKRSPNDCPPVAECPEAQASIITAHLETAQTPVAAAWVPGMRSPGTRSSQEAGRQLRDPHQTQCCEEEARPQRTTIPSLGSSRSGKTVMRRQTSGPWFPLGHGDCRDKGALSLRWMPGAGCEA